MICKQNVQKWTTYRVLNQTLHMSKSWLTTYLYDLYHKDLWHPCLKACVCKYDYGYAVLISTLWKINFYQPQKSINNFFFSLKTVKCYITVKID